MCIIYINCWTPVDSIAAHFTEGLPRTWPRTTGFISIPQLILWANIDTIHGQPQFMNNCNKTVWCICPRSHQRRQPDLHGRHTQTKSYSASLGWPQPPGLSGFNEWHACPRTLGRNAGAVVMPGASWELGHAHHQLPDDRVWTTLQGQEQRGFPRPPRQPQQSTCGLPLGRHNTHLSSLPRATVSPWARFH